MTPHFARLHNIVDVYARDAANTDNDVHRQFCIERLTAFADRDCPNDPEMQAITDSARTHLKELDNG